MDEAQKWITLVGALVAAVTSVWSLWRFFHLNADEFKVGFGSLAPAYQSGRLVVRRQPQRPYRYARGLRIFR